MTMTFNAETFFKITAHLLTIGTLWVRSVQKQAEDKYGLDKDFTHRSSLTLTLDLETLTNASDSRRQKDRQMIRWTQ